MICICMRIKWWDEGFRTKKLRSTGCTCYAWNDVGKNILRCSNSSPNHFSFSEKKTCEIVKCIGSSESVEGESNHRKETKLIRNKTNKRRKIAFLIRQHDLILILLPFFSWPMLSDKMLCTKYPERNLHWEQFVVLRKTTSWLKYLPSLEMIFIDVERAQTCERGDWICILQKLLKHRYWKNVRT